MTRFSRIHGRRAWWAAATMALSTLGVTMGATLAHADDGWFEQAQAASGHQTFNNYCAQCHGPQLTGAAGPALVGPAFLAHWGNKPLSDLYDFEHQNMPATNPGSVPPDLMWKITAYILQKNGLPAGNTDVAANASRQLPATATPAK